MITIRNLTKVFNPGTINEVTAIRGLSCSIADRQFATIIGSNGAGKSTLLNLISGRFPSDEGEILFGEVNVTRWPEHRRAAHVGRVFQNPRSGTCASMTIEENFALANGRGLKPGLRWGVNPRDRERFRDKLALLGLGLENRLKDRVGLLSGGQRQSLTLLMATLQRPRVLLLDEHTAALDPRTAEQVLALTRQLVEELHLTTLMVTHNMKHAIELGDRLIMMHQGGVVLDVAGEPKGSLTIQELMNAFASLRMGEMVDDKMLLVC